MKSIYVAGASAELDLVSGYIRELNENGWNISHDWTETVRASRARGMAADADLSDELQLKVASDDLEAVFSSDVVWLVVPSAPTIGAWIEFGAAVSAARVRALAGTPVVVASGDVRRTIFLSLAGKRFATHEEAFVWLTGGMP